MFFVLRDPFNDIYFSAVVSLCDRREQKAVFQCQSAVKNDDRNVFTVKDQCSIHLFCLSRTFSSSTGRRR